MSKTITVAFAAMLLAATGAAAQERDFALNATRNAAPAHSFSGTPAAFKVNITQPHKDSLVFRLSVENPGADKVVLLIKDQNHNVLHREIIPATPVFMGRYNLQGLEDGAYTFEIRNGRNGVIQKTVDIRTQLSVNRLGSIE
ncbi:MAG TPA: hypothetical protein VFS25_20600 [Chitinophaga sp.]|uniref:hypothetical protein n=1 Tax=Chitinophaga sp. TaxID=1869181 RepID=UPI002DB64848|nr:hypothetical protein [Chitinophaga sp.]HEU4555261.1 hypothetical protein [Chitinophaga sp.]